MVKFSWDADKAAQNIVKHGISFSTAKLVFDDPYLVLRLDDYPEEERMQAIGFAEASTLLLVVHTENYAQKDDSVIRIISARHATRRERNVYWQALLRFSG